MSETKPGITRMNLDIDQRLYARFIKCFPHGIRSDIQRRLITLAVEAVEQSGSLMLGAILSGDFVLVYDPNSRRHNMTPTVKDDKGG